MGRHRKLTWEICEAVIHDTRALPDSEIAVSHHISGDSVCRIRNCYKRALEGDIEYIQARMDRSRIIASWAAQYLPEEKKANLSLQTGRNKAQEELVAWKQNLKGDLLYLKGLLDMAFIDEDNARAGRLINQVKRMLCTYCMDQEVNK